MPQSSIVNLVRFACLCLCLGFASATVAQTYTVTDMGTLGGKYSEAFSINDRGEVVGHALTPDGDMHAFLYQGGALFDMNTLGGTDSSAYVITNSGIMIGNSRTADGYFHPFLSALNSPLFDLGAPEFFSTALNVNNIGHVVGFKQATDEHGQFHKRAFIFRDGRMIDLGTFGGKEGEASAINDAGQVVGHLYTEYHDGAKRAVLVNGDKTTSLGTLGGADTTAVAINNAGQIVGYSQTAGGEPRAFLYIGRRIRSLGTLPGGTQSLAYGINDDGQVVGASDTAAGSLRAFIYTKGMMQDLNQLIAPDTGWILTEARDINQAGQIVGTGIINGQQHAFLLSPTGAGVVRMSRIASNQK